MIIDSHQHFWKYNPIKDAWIDDSMQTIRRDFLPKDLIPILQDNTIDGCIAIQADQSESETIFLLDLADNNPFIKGVVGWVDLCAENIEERLTFFSKQSKFKGVRHIVQAESDDFMLQKCFQNGISKLRQFNLVYDVLIRKEQLESTIKLVEKFPKQLFVINHLAKPNIKEGEIEPWKTQIEALAKNQNVFCKISGLVTEANLSNWNYEDFTPYLDVIFNAFGVNRIVFGSDWPVCLLAGKYSEIVAIIKGYINSFSEDEKQKIMGKNAVKIYAL